LERQLLDLAGVRQQYLVNFDIKRLLRDYSGDGITPALASQGNCSVTGQE
jgi:hypothetical protein